MNGSKTTSQEARKSSGIMGRSRLTMNNVVLRYRLVAEQVKVKW